MMTAMTMMEMVAMLVGADCVAVGWVVHLVISAIIGAAYVLSLGPATRSYGRGAGLGAVYGAIVWVVGALVVMPLWLGMSEMVFVVGQDQVMSLAGHLVYGLVLGLVYFGAMDRASVSTQART
jgi:uncharacterized membrane protein YagU involved in acid resistance